MVTGNSQKAGSLQLLELSALILETVHSWTQRHLY